MAWTMGRMAMALTAAMGAGVTARVAYAKAYTGEPSGVRGGDDPDSPASQTAHSTAQTIKEAAHTLWQHVTHSAGAEVPPGQPINQQEQPPQQQPPQQQPPQQEDSDATWAKRWGVPQEEPMLHRMHPSLIDQPWFSEQMQQQSRTHDPHLPSMSQAGYRNPDLPPARAPGAPRSVAERVEEYGAKALQSLEMQFGPMAQFQEHFEGTHYDPAETGPQRDVHIFAAALSPDFRQCAVYDSDRPDARLIGIEYLISPRLFKGLDADEKRYWHEHTTEVTESTLSLPRLPEAAQRVVLDQLAPMYGKTFFFWDIEKGDAVPLGLPKPFVNGPEAYGGSRPAIRV